MEHKTPFILTDAGRYCDLMKQGFMKPLKAPKAKKPVIRVACCGCENWHVKGQHTLTDATQRKANFERYKANDRKFGRPTRRSMEEIISR